MSAVSMFVKQVRSRKRCIPIAYPGDTVTFTLEYATKARATR